MNRNDRLIVGLVMLGHALVHTYELSIPVLVTVWLDQFGASAATMGLVVTVGYALFGLGALPGGILADAVGSRRMIAACLAGMGLSFVVLGLAGGLPSIALALLIWGAAASVYHPSGLALISRGVTDRPTGFAYHGMAGNAGIAFGPLATTVLLVVFGWRTVVVLLAIPAALGTVLALWADFDEKAATPGAAESADGVADHSGSDGSDGGEEVRADGAAGGDGPEDGPPVAEDGSVGADPAEEDADPADDGGRDVAGGVSSLPEFLAGTRALFVGAFALVFLVMVSSGLYYRGVLTFLPEILAGFEGFEPVEVGGRTLEPSRFAYVGLLTVGMAGQFAGGRLTGVVDPARGIVGAFAGLAVLGLVFVPASEAGLGVLAVVGVALGFTLFLVQPMYQELVARLTPSGTRGLSYGYAYLGVFGVGAFGGAIAGWILTHTSATTLFGVLAAVALFAAGLGVVLSFRD